MSDRSRIEYPINPQQYAQEQHHREQLAIHQHQQHQDYLAQQQRQHQQQQQQQPVDPDSLEGLVLRGTTIQVPHGGAGNLMLITMTAYGARVFTTGRWEDHSQVAALTPVFQFDPSIITTIQRGASNPQYLAYIASLPSELGLPPSTLFSPFTEAALTILSHYRGQESKGELFIHLTTENARDPILVDEVLK